MGRLETSQFLRENNGVDSTAVNNFAREVLLESVPTEQVGNQIDIVDEPSDDSQVTLKSHTFECSFQHIQAGTGKLLL